MVGHNCDTKINTVVYIFYAALLIVTLPLKLINNDSFNLLHATSNTPTFRRERRRIEGVVCLEMFKMTIAFRLEGENL